MCVQVVSEDREKIRAEELQCKEMADNAQKDLDEALPALEEALKVNLLVFLYYVIMSSINFFLSCRLWNL